MLAVGGIDSGLYDAALFVHVMLVVVGVGSSFVWPALVARAAQLDPAARAVTGRMVYDLSKLFTSLALFLAGIVGFGVAGFSKNPGNGELVFKPGQAWLDASIGLWVVGVVLGFFVLQPAQRRAAELAEQIADERDRRGADVDTKLAATNKRIASVGGALQLIVVVILFLMIVKPGR